MNTACGIDEFQKSDWAQAVRLWKRVPGLGLNLADEQAGIFRFLERNAGLSLVARDDDELVGTVLTGYDGRRGYIYHACVAPEYQGRGIGKALMTECLARLEALGLDKASLYCKVDNASGQAFWAHSGWKCREDLVLFSWDF